MKNIKKVYCSVPGCQRIAKVKKRMLCNTHVARLYRRGDPGDGYIRPRRTVEELAAFIMKEKKRLKAKNSKKQ